MDALKDRIYHTLYATNHPRRTRTQPMQVIAVGISRSATESLQQALHTLGIEHVWHGYDSILPPYCLEEWYKLVVKKWRSPPSQSSMTDGLKVTREDFDAIIGHCAGISDLPGATFARELIAAYPEAKVILNTRSDMAGWYSSFASTIGTFDKDPKNWDWCKSWFWYFKGRALKRDTLLANGYTSAELFWARQFMSRSQLPGFFAGSFASNGVWVYQEHIAMVRGLGLPSDRLLEWQAADGWEPLCEFLNKPVPADIPFPKGNPTTEWMQRTGATMQEHNRRALRNMAVFGTLVAAFFSWLAYAVILQA
jgi:hypothetical protein